MIYLLLLILVGVVVFMFYNTKKTNKSYPDTQKNIDKDLNFAVFEEKQIRAAARQVLECAYLMAASKNIETIINRYELLENRLPSVRKAYNSQLGKLHITEMVVDYEEQHGLPKIEGYQDNMLLIADKNERKVFFAKTLLIGFEKHYEKQMKEISKRALCPRHTFGAKPQNPNLSSRPAGRDLCFKYV